MCDSEAIGHDHEYLSDQTFVYLHAKAMQFRRAALPCGFPPLRSTDQRKRLKSVGTCRKRAKRTPEKKDLDPTFPRMIPVKASALVDSPRLSWGSFGEESNPLAWVRGGTGGRQHC